MKKRPAILMVLMLFTTFSLFAQVSPTNEWVNYFSTGTTYDGTALLIGSVIKAYDPSGIQCGEFVTTTEGQYGFLTVYRDDPTTSDIDEGAQPGDTINFYINGHYAIPLGPGQPVWTSNGDNVQVHLEGHSNYAPTITSKPDTNATENQLYQYQMTAKDIDKDTLIFRLTTKPEWLDCDSLTGAVFGTPLNNHIGDNQVSVHVTDNHGGEVVQSFIIHVKPATGLNDTPVNCPEDFYLGNSYPNPFNATTTIQYTLPKSVRVTLSVYDMNGRIVQKLVDEQKAPGYYLVQWNAEHYPSGVYFYRIQAGDFSEIRKCMLIK